MSYVLRAVWPIRDSTVPAQQIATEATEELPRIIHEARAELTGPGHWQVLRSSQVPGSGGATPHVLVFTAPARRKPAREYHRPS